MAEFAPSFERCDPSTQIQQSWLGKVDALLAKWNMEEVNAFRTSADGLGVELLRANNITKIFGTRHRTIGDLELQVLSLGAGTTGPGAIFDFTRVLRAICRPFSLRLSFGCSFGKTPIRSNQRWMRSWLRRIYRWRFGRVMEFTIVPCVSMDGPVGSPASR